MKVKRFGFWALLLVMAFVLMAGGCGGGGSSNSPSTPPSPPSSGPDPGLLSPLEGTWRIVSGEYSVNGALWAIYQPGSAPDIKMEVDHLGGSAYLINFNGHPVIVIDFEGVGTGSTSSYIMSGALSDVQIGPDGEYRWDMDSSIVAETQEIVYKLSGTQLQYTHKVATVNHQIIEGWETVVTSLTFERVQ